MQTSMTEIDKAVKRHIADLTIYRKKIIKIGDDIAMTRSQKEKLRKIICDMQKDIDDLDDMFV